MIRNVSLRIQYRIVVNIYSLYLFPIINFDLNYFLILRKNDKTGMVGEKNMNNMNMNIGGIFIFILFIFVLLIFANIHDYSYYSYSFRSPRRILLL